MDRALDLKPEVTQGCGFESRLRQKVHDCSPGAAQSAAHCSKCVHLDGLNAENTFHSSLLCIIVYVTNKAHPSLICNLYNNNLLLYWRAVLKDTIRWIILHPDDHFEKLVM